jgi:hypothetical protein
MGRGGKELVMSRSFRTRAGTALIAACVLVPAAVVVAPGIVSAVTSRSTADPHQPPQTSPPSATSGAQGPVSMASGSAQRTFVSAGSGSDANPCTRALPCRNFAAAIAQTAAGGEVIALDSGGYGPVTIGSSISLIAAPGVYAGITAFSGAAVTISAGASDVVTLRGLTLNGLGGDEGVNFQSGGALYVQQDVIKGFNSYGLLLEPTNSASVRVEDTTVSRSGTGVFLGSVAGGAIVKATIVNSRFEDGFNGVDSWQQSDTAVQNSVASGNSSVGFYAEFGNVSLDGCESDHNQWGAFAYGTLYSSSTMFVRDGTGVSFGGSGQAVSWGNNRLGNNMANGAFSSTTALQ